MKVESTNVKPAFVPVTITLETPEELAFYRDVLGRTTGALASAYGIPITTFSAAYDVLKEQCSLQGAPEYMSRGFSIIFERKDN
jgi:hypothetical protein